MFVFPRLRKDFICHLQFTPMQCVTNHARQMGIQSSLHMPDKVLNFVKDHFLMDSVIRSAPLLLKRSVRYTQIAVHKIQGMERAYDVLFIGTGNRSLHNRGKSLKRNFKVYSRNLQRRSALLWV